MRHANYSGNLLCHHWSATDLCRSGCAPRIVHSPKFQEGTSVVGVWALDAAGHWLQLRWVPFQKKFLDIPRHCHSISILIAAWGSFQTNINRKWLSVCWIRTHLGLESMWRLQLAEGKTHPPMPISGMFPSKNLLTALGFKPLSLGYGPLSLGRGPWKCLHI